MKAREYASQLFEVGISEESIAKMVKTLVGEIETIAKQRNCKTTDAYNGCFKEIDDKYRAICRIVNKDREIMIESGLKAFIYGALGDGDRVLKGLDYFKGMKL